MATKLYRGFIIGLLSLSLTANAQKDPDVFVGFALQQREKVPGLQKNPAPVFPQVLLPWDATPAKAFAYGNAIHTQQQLDVELSRMRKQFAPFMLNLAPALPFKRLTVPLNEFEWKLVASEMTRDANGSWYPVSTLRNVSDSTQWKKVTIPHYEGPINKAEAIYRKEITITKDQLTAGKLFLHFNGVDYISKVFINHKLVGEHTGLSGAFEFDIRSYLHTGKNLLEIKVYNDAIMMGDNFFTGPGRKFGTKLAASGGPGWDQQGWWANCPPGFGIWQKCYLEKRAPVFINDLYVRPLLQQSAAMVSVQIPADAKDVSLFYSLYGQNFKATIHKKNSINQKAIASQEGNSRFKTITFRVNIPKDALRSWSPDAPWLYQLQVYVVKHGKAVDAVSKQFGMRSFEQSSTSIPKGRFYLNGAEIKLRGANMMGNIMQCVMQKNWRQLEDDILLAKIVGMNFWRMTQQPCQEEAYDYFDKLGLMAQTDMPAFNGYRKDVVDEVLSQFKETMHLIRNHPSNIVLSYLNEPDFSKPMMLSRKEHEQLFYSFDSLARKINPGQVTKWIDGDYVNLSPRFSDHHDYSIWYGDGIRSKYFGEWHDTRANWMYGCGEFGAEGLDDIELMQKRYPLSWIQPNSEGKWNPAVIFRCQTPTVGKKWLALKDSTQATWVTESRAYQQSAIRLFSEALRRNNHMNSFAVHLLIDAWPAGWLKSLVGVDRRAKPAYFEYRNALRPVAVNLRPDAFYGFSGDSSHIAVFVCNDKANAISGAHLRYQVLQNGQVLYTGIRSAAIRASEAAYQGSLKFKLPIVQQREPITVVVALFDAKNKLIHDSAHNIEVFPASDRGKKLDRPGGYAQVLIAK